MSKFSNTKPRKVLPPEPPKPEEAPDLALTAETFTALEVEPEPVPASPVEVPKRSGRPKGVPRDVVSIRLKPETIVEADALKVGLKLKSQGEAFERAISFYKAHIIAKTRHELRLAPEVDDEAVLLKAFKADD